MPASRLCLRCEKPTMARTDDTEWTCFNCGFIEHRSTPDSQETTP